MKLAVYCKHIEALESKVINNLLEIARNQKIELTISQCIRDFLADNSEDAYPCFKNEDELLNANPKALLSIGGDGTLLDTILLVNSSEIPVLGINTGRLGFLSNILPKEIESALLALKKDDFSIEKRTLLETHSNGSFGTSPSYALNDFSIHKRDTSSMITINAYLNGEYFNTYWADGLLVSSPTGSTAYALSCGGPIIFPEAKCLLITPVAPHNLNVRSIVISDETEISFIVEGRGSNYLLAEDSRNAIVDYGGEIKVRKAPFQLSLIKLSNKQFVKTLQDKLNWGKDHRNLAL